MTAGAQHSRGYLVKKRLQLNIALAYLAVIALHALRERLRSLARRCS